MRIPSFVAASDLPQLIETLRRSDFFAHNIAFIPIILLCVILENGIPEMHCNVGVAQMNVGVILSLFNQRYFRDKLSIICEFVPQMIFLNALFGYLCILIIAKWISGSYADLYHIMIYMFLQPGNVDCTGSDGVATCPRNKMFAGQGGFQVHGVVYCMIFQGVQNHQVLLYRAIRYLF